MLMNATTVTTTVTQKRPAPTQWAHLHVAVTRDTQETGYFVRVMTFFKYLSTMKVDVNLTECYPKPNCYLCLIIKKNKSVASPCFLGTYLRRLCKPERGLVQQTRRFCFDTYAASHDIDPSGFLQF